MAKSNRDLMTKNFAQFALTVLCFLLIVQFCLAQNSIDAEEYAVYSDLLKNTYGDDPASQFAIEKNVRAHFTQNNGEYLVKKSSSIDINLIKSFNEQNKLPAEVQDQFNLKSKVNLLTETKLEVIFKPERSYGETAEEDWANFREKFQTFSLLSLSRVGFNKNRDKALVVLGSQYGWLGGDGFYYLLVRKREGWKVKKKVRAWIS